MKAAVVLVVMGTRPEVIKLAPVIKKLEERKASGDDPVFNVMICATGQHREMFNQTLDFFGMRVNYNLNIMIPDQSLFDITAKCLMGLRSIMHEIQPAFVMVQGDTTTAFAAALAGYYDGRCVVHVEAGLRTHDKVSPFPEEMNRVLIARIADIHFAPTKKAKENLLSEGIREQSIHVVGNTVVDALFMTLKIIAEDEGSYAEYFRSSGIDLNVPGKRVILVTSHRRESFGEPFRNICWALRDLAVNHGTTIIYPVHLNPNVKVPVHEILGGVSNVHLIEPLGYPHIIWLMKNSDVILTDSGGIQEEAPSLGKPVLVMRNVTERPEGIEAGTAKLVGTDRDRIVRETLKLLEDRDEYERMAHQQNPYGDGKAADRIVRILNKAALELAR